MIDLCIDNLKKMGAIPAARLYHTKYRELSPPLEGRVGRVGDIVAPMYQWDRIHMIRTA